MPTYDFECPDCGVKEERKCPYEMLNRQVCDCGRYMNSIWQQAPLGRVQGVIPKGGGPDKFTADMLGIPLKDLPPGLKT